MIINPITEKAKQIACEALKGYCDEAGNPYIQQSLHIAEHMDCTNDVCIALLYNVAGSFGVTLTGLRDEGFSDGIINALSLLAFSDGMDYAEYIEGIKSNPHARKVKLFDLMDKCDTRLLKAFDEDASKDIEKREMAIRALTTTNEPLSYKPYKGLHKKDFTNKQSATYRFSGLDESAYRSIEKAKAIACKAHDGQVDKAGQPYILHPLHLAEHMQSKEEIIVALLHDVAEDTDITLMDLREHGFSYPVIDALSLLTHAKGVDYMEYVNSIKFNPLASKVKLFDLLDNSDIRRLKTIDEKMEQRLNKYARAIDILQSGKNLQSYSPGKKGDIKYFKTERSAIIKVTDGVSAYNMDDNGCFEPCQHHMTLFGLDSMVDYKRMDEEEVNKEIATRKKL